MILANNYKLNVIILFQDGNHCLHYKNALRSRTIVSLFLQTNAAFDPPNSLFCTPLTIACEIDDSISETVHLLLEYGASVNGLPKVRCTS